MKLGLGEFEPVDSEGYSREFTQTRFLITAEKIHPQILIEARDGPYPLFRDLFNTILPDDLDEFCANLNTGWRFLESIAEAKAFLDSLLQWARRWNLEADWCIERTIMAMRRYYSIKDTISDFSWFYPLYTVLPGEDGKKPYKDKIDNIFDYPILDISGAYDFGLFSPPPPPGGLLPWNPYLYPLKEGYLPRTEWDARQRLENDPLLSIVEKSHQEAYIRQFKQKVAEYAEKVTAYAKSQASLKLVRSKPKLKTHLEWTVQVWVLDKNFNEVARSAEPKQNGKMPTWKAVKKAVKEILELIEPDWAARLEERFPPGRPGEIKSES